MEADFSERLLKLEHLAKNEVYNIFYGCGIVGSQTIPLCADINRAIDFFLDFQLSIDFSSAIATTFLRSTLPILIEILIRRSTLREHGAYVAYTLVKTSKLLARPPCQNFLELCDLRNILLTGNFPPLKFITVKQIKPQQLGSQSTQPQRSGSGFFIEHGKPELAVCDSKLFAFWPDEWEKVLGGVKAVGNFVQVFIPVKNQNQNTGSGGWRRGRVVEYITNENKYRVLLDIEGSHGINKNTGGGAGNSTMSYDETASGTFSTSTSPSNSSGINSTAIIWESEDMIRLNFAECTHSWAGNGQRQGSLMGKKTPNPNNHLVLDYTSKDVGGYCRVWWSKDKRYYYGKIVAFDVLKKMHKISYEDHDVRSYDMATKEYELIQLPASFNFNGAKDDAECASIVSAWHSNTLARSIEIEKNPESAPIVPGDIDDVNAGMAACRPPASQAQGTSMHYYSVINAYFNEGGREAMFQSLSDPGKPAPMCGIIASHLQLIYLLKKILNRSLVCDLIWDAKEGVPFSFNRYGDGQFKEFSRSQFEEVTGLVRQLVLYAVPKVQGLEENLEYLRLSMSAKLLTCSQLQKRYFGLSMLREAVELAMPSAATFVKKRSAYLAVGTGSAPLRLERSRDRSPIMRIEALQAWILSNRVFEEIVGESIHQDLVSKSSIILVFLGHRRALTEKHIDALWLATKKAHEAVVRVLHLTILLIVPVLEPYLRMHLFALISAVPYRDYTEQILHLIKSYTLHALAAFREDNVNTVKSSADSLDDSDSGTASLSTGMSGKNGRAGPVGSGAERVMSVSRKGMVVSAPQRQWLGFGVLWQFIQDPTAASGSAGVGEGGVDEGLVDLATQLLVDLLEDEFKDERELILQRCLDNIQMGMSVPVSLRLLRKTLATYPLPTRYWFKSNTAKLPTICSQIEKLQRQHKMLDIVFTDVASYHSALANQSSSHNTNNHTDSLIVNTGLLDLYGGGNKSEGGSGTSGTTTPGLSAPIPMKRARSTDFSLNDKRIQINGKVGRTSHLKGVIERLDFLQFVFSRSSLTITSAQLQLLWRSLGEEAVTNETLDQLIFWIDSMVTKENKTFTSFLTALAQETDPKNSSLPSKLACLSPRDNLVPQFSLSPEGEETSSAFEEGSLVKLFEGSILPWVTRRDKIEVLNRAPLAILCLKLFLLVNVTNKSIKVETDGSWVRLGQLSGIALLWRMAVCCSDNLVHEAAISLLVELHHRIPQVKFKNNDVIRGHILRISFKQLSIAMQSLRAGDSEKYKENNNNNRERMDRSGSLSPTRQELGSYEEGFFASTPLNYTDLVPSGTPTPNQRQQQGESDMTQTLSGTTFSPSGGSGGPVGSGGSGGSGPLDEWFDDGDILMDPKAIARVVARLIMLLLLYIQRFDNQPSQLITLQILAGRDDSPVLMLTLRSTETIGTLRAKVANHVKEPADLITLFKPVRASAQSISGALLGREQEKLENNDMTLRQAKFLPHDSVIAKKKEAVTPSGNSGKTPGEKGPLLEDLITSKDLSEDLLALLQPLEWLSSNTSDKNSNNTLSNTAAVTPSALQETQKLSGPSLLLSMFQLSPFPLPIKADMTLSDVAPEKNSSGLSSLTTPTHTATQGQVQQAGNVTDIVPAGQGHFDALLPIIKQSPQHMDQLLAMLDGYLSSEIQGAAGVGFDLSAAVWAVLQSLPTHPALLKQVRAMPSDATGGSIRVLLNLASPYRLLYVLQMIDSFFSEDDRNTFSQSIPLSKWTLELLYMGGAEHVVQLIEDTMKLLTFSKCKDSDNIDIQRERGQQHEKKSTAQKPDNEAPVLILGMLYRILHRLLLMDPLYNRWQAHSSFGSKDRTLETLFEFPPTPRPPVKEGVMKGLKGPPGLVLTCINASAFIKSAMECVHGLFRQSVCPSSMQALSENALVVVMGLLSAADDGLQVLDDITISQLPVTTPVQSDFTVYDGDAGVQRSRSTSKQHVQDADISMNEVPSLKQWIKCYCLSHPDQELRRGVCLTLFKALINIYYTASDSSLPSEISRQKLDVFECVFHAVACTAHTGYDMADGGLNANASASVSIVRSSAVSTAQKSRTGVRSDSPPLSTHSPLLQAEQIYGLLASLLALRSTPLMIFPPSNAVIASKVASTHLEFYRGDVEIFSELFATQLMSHRSVESFHSTQPDGALVGILRILLILSSCLPSQRRKLGRFKRKILSIENDKGRGSSNSSSGSGSGETLLSFLYLNCLFPKEKDLSSDSSSKGEIELDALGALCQTSVSRETAYALIFQLCKSDQSNLALLVPLINRAERDDSGSSRRRGGRGSTGTGKRLVQWEYDPCDLIKEEGSFVGLVNQGATCYMNSLVQQLYHIPAFSSGLLSISSDQNNENSMSNLNGSFDACDTALNKDKDRDRETDRENNNSMISSSNSYGISVDNDNEVEVENNTLSTIKAAPTDDEKFLFQLQVMFGYLRLSEKRFYDTMSFCKAFTDYDGSPISTVEQKDINEFAGMLFDKLESNKECSALLSRTIKGKILWRTRSIETPYKSDREENFFMVTAEVKDKATLEESLELFVGEELFSGDNKLEDPDAGRKVEALRRCTFRELPPTLIIHLKRFEFNIETMDRKKVDDHLTFPTDLNMLPYTEEGIAAKENKKFEKMYSRDDGEDDSGVSGHSAFIKPDAYYQYTLKGIVAHVGAIDRGHYYSFIKERSTDKWLEFNDRTVLPFSAEAIPAECFGGEESTPAVSGVKRMKQNSAYLLLYERKEPLDTEDLEPHMESKGMNMGGSGTGAGVEKDVKGGRIPVRVASEVLLTAEKMLEIDVEGEGEGEKGSRNDLVAPIFEDVKAAEERKRSSDADMSMFRYPSEAKGEGEDEGKREEDEDRKEGGGLEGEGGEGEIEGDKNRERRVNFSADSWDEFEIKKEESATQENVQEYNTHIHTPHKEDRSFLKPESGNGCKVRRRIQEYPPIAKKVLQAVWTENLEFQTDRSLFNRIHFNFLWQLQRSPVVVEMLTEKSKSGIHHSSSLPSSPTSPTASSSSASLLLPPPSAPSLDSFLIESQTNGISKSRSDSSSSSSSGSSRAHKTDPNKSITSPDSKYNDGAGHTGSTGKFLMENTLAQLSVTCLRFNVEVLARARASGCVHSFFEHLEEMVIYDTGRVCARALIQELVIDVPVQPLPTPTPLGSPDGSNSSQASKQRAVSTKEKASVLQTYHPWLLSIFLSCPHEHTVRTFCRFLMTCIKVLRPTEKYCYLDTASTSFPSSPSSPSPSYDSRRLDKNISGSSSGIRRSSSSSSHNGGTGPLGDTLTLQSPGKSTSKDRDRDREKEREKERERDRERDKDRDRDGRGCKYVSCVTILIDKLLSVFERVSTEEILGRDGYRLLSSFFLQVATLGVEEKALLLKVGAVRRVIRAVVSINASVAQAPPEDVFHSTDLVGLLIRSSIVPPPEGSKIPTPEPSSSSSSSSATKKAAPAQIPGLSPFHLPEITSLSPEKMALLRNDLVLSPEDLPAFLNRGYLEETITISPTQTALALQHLCWSRNAAETSRILIFLGDRISECVMCNTGVDLSYRPYFRIMSELLLSAAVECPVGFDSVVPSLLQRAEAIVGRQSANDSEFLYVLLKLLHRIGTRSLEGHKCVKRVKEQWRSIVLKWDKVKRGQSYRGGAAGRVPGPSQAQQAEPTYATVSTTEGSMHNVSYMLG